VEFHLNLLQGQRFRYSNISILGQSWSSSCQPAARNSITCPLESCLRWRPTTVEVDTYAVTADTLKPTQKERPVSTFQDKREEIGMWGTPRRLIYLCNCPWRTSCIVKIPNYRLVGLWPAKRRDSRFTRRILASNFFPGTVFNVFGGPGPSSAIVLLRCQWWPFSRYITWPVKKIRQLISIYSIIKYDIKF
jgi:hypothetical protein